MLFVDLADEFDGLHVLEPPLSQQIGALLTLSAELLSMIRPHAPIPSGPGNGELPIRAPEIDTGYRRGAQGAVCPYRRRQARPPPDRQVFQRRGYSGFLLSVFAKDEKSDLSKDEKNELKKLL